MHNKTLTSLTGWLLSVGGWFLWTIILSALFKPSKTYLLYPIKSGFLHQFGNNLLWWLVLLLTLACLIVFELGISSIRKSFWPTETDLFQELQKDPLIRQRFEDRLKAEEAGESMSTGKEEGIKTSMEEQLQREGEIQELLDRRRIISLSDAEVVRSPIDIDSSANNGGGFGSLNGKVMRSASGGNLTRRKFSVERRNAGFDVEEFELQGRITTSPTKTRHSVDVAEVLGRR
jgi:phospholipid-translocating ATPase